MNDHPQEPVEPENQPPQGDLVPPAEGPIVAPVQPAVVEISKSKRNLQIAAGFLGWFVVNGLFALAVFAFSRESEGFGSLIAVLIPFIALLLNIGVLIVLAVFIQTRWIALGILAAMGLVLALSLLAGLLLSAYCLVLIFTQGL